MPTSPDANKATVTAFYDLMFNQGRPAEAVERYVGSTQHNPMVADGKDAFIDYFTRNGAGVSRQARGVPSLDRGKASMSSCTATSIGQETATGRAFDIFRLDDDGRIMEHWDVLQRVPDASVNGNTMF